MAATGLALIPEITIETSLAESWKVTGSSDRVSDCVVTAALHLDGIAAAKPGWGVFRNRRPDLYGVLLEPTPDRLLTRQAA